MSFPLSTFGNTDQVLQSLEVLGDGHINGNLDVDGTVTASQFAGGTIIQVSVYQMVRLVILL